MAMARKFVDQPSCTRLAEKDVARVWKTFLATGDDDDRNKLVEHYYAIVKYHANAVHAKLPEGVELDDLITAGIFGLMDAMQRFDLDRGVKFETFCVPRVRGAMLDMLREMDWVPRLVRSKASKLNALVTEFQNDYGRDPTTKEIARRMVLSIAEAEKLIEECRPVDLISLDKKWFETDSWKDVRQIDLLLDKNSEPPSTRHNKQVFLSKITRGLNRNERLIMILYYYEEQTMKEIGSTLQLSESRISQMHTHIIEKLAKSRSKEELQELLV